MVLDPAQGAVGGHLVGGSNRELHLQAACVGLGTVLAEGQLVNHGHFNLNGKRVDIPSIRINPGDELEVRDKSKKSFYFVNIDDIIGDIDTVNLSWLVADRKKFIIKVNGLPERQELEDEINEQLIVEYYSR